MITEKEIKTIIAKHGEGFKFTDIPEDIRKREGWKEMADYYNGTDGKEIKKTINSKRFAKALQGIWNDIN